MAKRRREKVSDDSTSMAGDCYTAFIDTTLGTHLAMMISSSDTVSDLKKKIVQEHFQLFPGNGEIKVLSLQVKRLGHFYHLPDSMLVFSAYEGSKRHKILFVDASSSEDDREQKSSEPDNIKHIQLENSDQLSPESGLAAKKQKTEHNENEASGSRHMKKSSLDHEIETAVVGAGKSIPIMMEVRDNHVSGELCKTSDLYRSDFAAALETSQSEPAVEKSLNLGMEENVRDHSHSGKRKKVTKLATCTTDKQENLSVSNAASEQLKDDQPVNSLGSKKRKKRRERTSSVPSDQAANPESTPIQNIEKEKIVKGNLETGCMYVDKLSDLTIVPGEGVQPETFHRPSDLSQKGTSSDIIDKVLEVSKRACSLEGNVDGKITTVDQTAELGADSKTSSMKLQASVMEDSASPAIIGLNDMNKVSSQVHDENIHLGTLDSVTLLTDGQGQDDLKLNQDREVMPSESCEALDEGDADRTNEASTLLPKLTATSEPMGTVTSDGTKRKRKRAKKKAAAMLTDSVVEQTNMAGANPSDGLNLDVEDHIVDKTNKDECTLQKAESDQTNRVEEERGLSGNVDPQGKTSECLKPRDCAEAEVPTKPAVHSSDLLRLNEAMDVGNPTGKKKKRKTEKSAAKVQGISEVEYDLNNDSGISLSAQNVNFSNQMTGYDTKSESQMLGMGTDQNTAILGDKQLSMEQENVISLPSGSEHRHMGETDININQSATTSMLKAQEVKSGKRRKKKKMVKSAVINQDGSEKEFVDTVNAYSALSDSPANNVADETKHCLSILSQNVWKDALKDESMDTSVLGAHREGDKVIDYEAHTEVDLSHEDRGDKGKYGRQVRNNSIKSVDNGIADLPVENQTNEVQGLQQNQSGELKEHDCNLNEKAKKKKKKNQFSASENLSTSEIKEQSNVAEELAGSGNKTKGKDIPSFAAKTSRLAEKGTVVQSTASVLELGKNPGTESSPNHEHVSKDANPSQVPSKGSPESEVDNIKTAKCKNEVINFRHYFVPGQHQDKVFPSSVKVKQKLTKPKSKQEKHNVVAENKLESSENHGIRYKSDGRYIDDNRVEESASSDENNKALFCGNKNTLEASEHGVKAPSSHEIKEDKTLEKAIKPVVVDGAGTSTKTSKRNQQSGFSHNNIPKRNSSSKSAGDILNSSGQKKSSLFTPRLVFRLDGSESSSDENQIVNSDASTRAPSDSSSSSGYSVGESKLSLDSKRNGSVNATRQSGAVGNIVDAKFSGPQQMSMDMVLRSSSRFKKAKLAASQSQAGDTGSQPVDFVPDSRAKQ